MGRFDKPDTQIDGQMTIDDLLNAPERLVAVSNIFARARKNMSLPEQKAFIYALTEINFSEPTNNNIVYLDKKTVAEIVGVHSDIDHLSVHLFEKIKDLPKHSYIEIAKDDIDGGLYDSGIFITRLTMLKNRVRIKFENEYMGLFSGLNARYITMWSTDIFRMTSKRTVLFYEYLRTHMDTREETHSILLGIRAFKELFGIPSTGEGSYMRKDGHLDRPAFEKRVIEPLFDDMKHCKMIKLLVNPDGSFFTKEKHGNRIAGYRFNWVFSARPGIATAEEVKEIRERVDKDPRVLKVANDLVKGEKKQSPKKKNSFTDFQQRDYDYDALEAALVRREEDEQ